MGSGNDRREGLFAKRCLTEHYPQLGDLELRETSRRGPPLVEDGATTLMYLRRLGPLHGRGEAVLVVGCGAKPETIRTLRGFGFECVGVEPVPSVAMAAKAYLRDEHAVLTGASEDLPVPDGSQHVVLLESVLEHVDSVERTLSEVHRVLIHGGIAYISTTNRLQFKNMEYRRRFFQFYPRMLKEAYVYQHLHYDPRLANYTTRPAVHWFTFADLCSAGRAAGFYDFYSKLDLLRVTDPIVARSRLRRLVLRCTRRSPFVRALALTQRPGGSVFMIKR